MTFPETTCKHYSDSVDRVNVFSGRMRFHQSWYRSIELGVEPGPNPHAMGVLYGNMLREADYKSNFLTPSICQAAEARFPFSNKDTGTARLYCNMLGSQTMCFNLFGPLMNLELATRLMQVLPGFPKDATVNEIRFEYAPPKEGHLNDLTSFDAFLNYERLGGRRGFIGIETKLTEPFSQEEYEFNDRYSRWMKKGTWWWKWGAETKFSTRAFNQLWRNHLLVYAMLNQDSPQYSEGYCAVAYPKGDVACSAAIKEYREHLLPSGDETLLVWPLETIAERWSPVMQSEDERDWFDQFQTRYLRLEKSEEAWQEFRKAMQ